MPAAAEQLLMAGVTSARDLGAPLEESIEIRQKIRSGEIAGPNLYVSGPFIQHEPYPGTEQFRWGIDGVAVLTFLLWLAASRYGGVRLGPDDSRQR